MTRRTASLVLDGFQLVVFLSLMSWRFTGLRVHEWAGLALLGALFIHLFTHWSWVEARVRAAGARPRVRRNVPLALNAALFLAMGTAMVSGVLVSKIVVPHAQDSATFLRWHGIHETSSTLTLLLIGLHVALNWARIRDALALALRADRVPALAEAWRLPALVGIRRVAWIMLVSALLTGAVWEGGKLVAAPTRIMLVHADGRREMASLPPDLGKVQPGSESPNPHFWPKLAMSAVVLSLATLAGTRVLKLRL